MSAIENLIELKYTYNAKGYLGSVTRTDKVNSITQKYSFNYNDFGDISKISVGNIALANYDYENSTGHLKKHTFSNNQYVKFEYDNLGQLEKKTWYDANDIMTRSLEYTYNSEGRLHSILEEPSGTVYTYNYDAIDRIISSDMEKMACCWRFLMLMTTVVA